MAKLTLADVQNAKAIPQIGDIVGKLQYKGGDLSDLSRYQPLDGRGALGGSIFDLEKDGAQGASAGTSMPMVAGPSLSGVKMLLPGHPTPAGGAPIAQGQPSRLPGAVTFAAAQDYSADPERFPQASWQPTSPSRAPVVPATDHGSLNWMGGRSVDPVQQARDGAANWAENQVGSTAYRMAQPNPDVGGTLGYWAHGRGAPKCNVFAGDAYAAAGIGLRDPTNSQVYLTAHVWGDPTSKIPGFVPVMDNKLQRGDILSNGLHMAIYDPGSNNEPETISAADAAHGNQVVHNDWGFRGTEGGKPIVVWRYTGPPLQSQVLATSPRHSKVPY